MKDQVRLSYSFWGTKNFLLKILILKELFDGKPFYLETYSCSTCYAQNELNDIFMTLTKNKTKLI